MAPLVRGLAKKDEIGIIDAVPFDADHRLDRLARPRRPGACTRYGWVDRKKGIIHIPIEEAMKEVIRQTPVRRPRRSRR